MTIEQILTTYVGRMVEIHQITQFQEGQLVGVDDGHLTILAEDSTYGTPPVSITFLLRNISFVRVLQ